MVIEEDKDIQVTKIGQQSHDESHDQLHFRRSVHHIWTLTT